MDWYNYRPLHGSLGMLSPAMYEDDYYAAQELESIPAITAVPNPRRFPPSPSMRERVRWMGLLAFELYCGCGAERCDLVADDAVVVAEVFCLRL